MSDDGYVEEGVVPPCDECGSEFGALWCDKCSVILCQECGAADGKHGKHPLGTIGTSDDPYDYAGDVGDNAADDQDDAAVAVEDLTADDIGAMLAGDTVPVRSKSGKPRQPRGVIEELISEDQAYHLVEMLECNAHLSCRRLFLPHVTEHARALARDGHPLDPFTKAAYDSSSDAVRLTPEQWAAFATTSYLVIDNFVAPDVALAAQRQTIALLEGGSLTEYKNPKDIGRDDSVRSDLRMFLAGTEAGTPAGEGPLKELVTRLEQLRAELAAGVKLSGERHEYQLAYYGADGQHYKKHRDAFPNDGSRHMTGQVGRRVTCTLYMNDYDDSHGGKIRLYVPNTGCTDETEVDVAPVAGRAVLFLSGAMDHEVLPSFAPRCAIAAWYS